MKQGFFNREQPAKCEYCEKGNISPTGKEILCPAKGIVPLDYSCKKFIYDPLKRQPTKMQIQGGFTAEDFKL